MTGQSTALTRARQVREVLLDHGVPEVAIGLVPGRPVPAGRDPWNALDPVGHTSHHIVSTPTPERPTPGLGLIYNGVPGLDGPLANGTAGVDLVYRIVTLGWANHPGYGGPLTLHGPLGAFTIPKDNGRPYLWGTEYEGGLSDAVWDRVYRNPRTGKTMTFREFMGRCNAGLAEAIWLPGLSSRGRTPSPEHDLSGYTLEHSTWAPTRKVDRRGYTTDSGRAEVRRFNTTHREDDMADEKTQAQLQRIEDNAVAGRRAAERAVEAVTDPEASKLLRRLERANDRMTRALELIRKIKTGQASLVEADEAEALLAAGDDE